LDTVSVKRFSFKACQNFEFETENNLFSCLEEFHTHEVLDEDNTWYC